MLSCFAKSTAHGLLNIGNEKNTYGRVVWLLLTIATIAGFGTHTYLLYSQLLDEHVLISTFPDAIPFIQPDIVFCSERIFARDYINNPPKQDYDYMFKVSKSIQKFDKIFQISEYKSSRLIWDSLNFHRIYKAFFHRKNELFLNLTCNDKNIDLNELKVEMNVVHFACYRLSSDVCKLNSPFISLIVKLYIHIYGKKIDYKTLNVNIFNKSLDSYQFVHKENVDDIADGVHVYFVQPNEAVNEMTTKITASAKSQTNIKIKSIKYKRQSKTKSKCQKSVKYDQFYNLLESNFKDNHLNLTQYSLCIYKQFQNTLYAYLKCVSKQFPIPITINPNFTFCGDLDIQNKLTIFRYSNMTSQNIYDLKEIIKKCEGSIPCNSIKHQATVNYNTWPWIRTLKNLLTIDIPMKLAQNKMNDSYPGLVEVVDDFNNNPRNLDNWMKNFIKITITSDEFMSTVIEEASSYSLKNFFSDIGGIMGFYMGASLLTVCELFRLLHYIMFKNKHSSKKNKDLEANSPDD